MDHQRFDAAVRALGRRITRRRGVAAAAGVLLDAVAIAVNVAVPAGNVAPAAPAAAAASAAAARTSRRQPARLQRKQKPGPCGDGSPEANACVRGKSCCTKYCVEGVCYCKPNYMICQRDSQCCSGRCVNGRCDGGCGRGRVPCEENFNCCDGFACIRNICKRSRKGSCDPSTCSGCCEGSVCRAGVDPLACGPGRGICQACRQDEVCSVGACVPAPDSCRATCSGCCAFGACQPGDSNGSCGRNGGYCGVCGGSTPNCAGGVCTGCAADGDCPPATPFCSANACVACRTVADCSSTAADACAAGACRCGGGAACSGARAICSGGTCVGCSSSSDCSGSTPVCSGGTCVGCSSDADCSGATPRCCSGACVAEVWSNRTTFGVTGAGEGELNSPDAVAVAADLLTVYVADRDNHRVTVWTRPSTSSDTWSNTGVIGSGPGSADAEFNRPCGVALSADGAKLFVSDRSNNRVSVWTRSGLVWSHSLNFAAASVSLPQGIAVNGAGTIAWIADTGNNRIAVWSNSGGPWAQQAIFGSSAEFDKPYGVAATSSADTALVADTMNSRIGMWGESGSNWDPDTVFGSEGVTVTQFFRPRGVAVSGDGKTAWVADTGNNRISIWTRPHANSTDWTNLAVFGKYGAETDRLSGPQGVAVSSDGKTAWIADPGNNRISVWIASCPA